jgi:hypothetical protein
MRFKKLSGAVCAGAVLVLAGSSLAVPCPADVDNDGTVGINDFLIVLAE